MVYDPCYVTDVNVQTCHTLFIYNRKITSHYTIFTHIYTHTRTHTHTHKQTNKQTRTQTHARVCGIYISHILATVFIACLSKIATSFHGHGPRFILLQHTFIIKHVCRLKTCEQEESVVDICVGDFKKNTWLNYIQCFMWTKESSCNRLCQLSSQ